MDFIIFSLGLLLLVAGGHFLVSSGSRLASLMKISPLTIGLTVVAFGTSTPELAVNIKAALAGKPDIAVGNVVGSNIFNILFILGLCSLLKPLKVKHQLIKIDVPIMVLASLIFFFFSADKLLSLQESLVLFLGILMYTIFSFWISKQEHKGLPENLQIKNGRVWIFSASISNNPLLHMMIVLISFWVLAEGGQLCVEGAVGLARQFGISELAIAIILVAAGTSLPELMTSLIGTLRGEREIAIGNVVGSNIYNIFCILGLTGIITKSGIPIAPQALSFDIPVMLAVSVVCLPVFFTGQMIGRPKGTFLILCYCAYICYLIL